MTLGAALGGLLYGVYWLAPTASPGHGPALSAFEQSVGSEGNRIHPVTGESDLVPAIGAIVNADRVICTGTLIGPVTVLTAAHCGHRYQKIPKPEHLSFVVGPRPLESKVRFPVLREDLPTAPPDAFGFDPENLKNDIALFTLSRKVEGVDPLVLRRFTSWSFKQNATLVFVAFGQNRSGGAADRKRIRAWPGRIGDEYSWNWNAAEGTNCHGDSGGPGFLVHPDGQADIVALLSGTVDKCQNGFGVRLEMYAGWLRGRRVLPAAAPSSQVKRRLP